MSVAIKIAHISNEEVFMLQKLDMEDFGKVYELMEESFPDDEYRSFGAQKALLENPLYSIYSIYDDMCNINAFVCIWVFDEFIYVEHLAVSKKYRNKGLGSDILRELDKKFQKMICLEVERPDNIIKRKRIDFYKKNGFFLSTYEYLQPAYSEEKNVVSLFIMTTGREIDKAQFEKIRFVLYSQVYGCHLPNQY